MINLFSCAASEEAPNTRGKKSTESVTQTRPPQLAVFLSDVNLKGVVHLRTKLHLKTKLTLFQHFVLNI